MASGASGTRVDARCYWVLLSMVPQVGPSRFQRLLDGFGDAEAAWRAAPLPLARAGLDRRAASGDCSFMAASTGQKAVTVRPASSTGRPRVGVIHHQDTPVDLALPKPAHLVS
jgi:hypothetical protein